MKGVPVRDVKFQRLFAQYAKGTYPLNRFAFDINIFKCSQRLCQLLARENVKLPISEINECGSVDNKAVLVCNDKEIHRFSCSDNFGRNKWIKKVNKLVDKRMQRLANINNGLLNIATGYSAGSKKISDANETDDELGSSNNTPASVIGTPTSQTDYGSINFGSNPVVTRPTRASIYRLSKIKQVEEDFD